MSKPSENSAQVWVVGGGPAGVAAAIGLALRGLSVRLATPAPAPQPLLGESLPPAIAPLLVELGVWADFVRGPHLKCYANESAWGEQTLRLHSFMTHPVGHGWHIERAALEAMLLDRARDLGVMMTPSSTSRAGAAFVIDATGRRSVVALSRGESRRHRDHQVAVVGLFRNDARAPSATSRVEAVEGGYWYSAPMPFGRTVCAYFTEPSCWARQARCGRERAFCDLLARSQHTRERSDGQKLVSIALYAAGSSRLTRFYGGDWLAVGDAAVTRDPLSSGGIYEGLRSGLRAARAVARHLAGDASAIVGYAGELEQRFERDARRRQRLYATERRFPVAKFWRERHALDHATPDRKPEEHAAWPSEISI